MSKRGRRDVDIFNMSFLDVVSCGFGAIILLLVIIQISEPRVIEQLAVDLTGLVKRLELEIYEIRGETTILNRDLTQKQEQLSVHREKLARLKGDLSLVRGEFDATRNEHETQSIIENQLDVAQQSLSEEVRRLNALDFRRPPDSAIGGVPVDSEYIMFSVWFQQLGAGPALSDKTKLRFIPAENPPGFAFFITGKWAISEVLDRGGNAYKAMP